MNIYLASYLGFSPEYSVYRTKIKKHLQMLGHEVIDPWDSTEHNASLENAILTENYSLRIKQMKCIAVNIGLLNEKLIRESDALLGVLDGVEVDSGVASEIGFAAGLGKRCYGLRTDFRDCGELDGIPVNLQVLHFILNSGGSFFRKIADIVIN